MHIYKDINVVTANLIMYILLTLSIEVHFFKEVSGVLKSQRSGKKFERSGKNLSVVAH